MKNKDVKVGVVYAVKVSGRIAPVRIDRETTRQSYSSRPGGGAIKQAWYGTNLLTNRQIYIQSGAKLRGEMQKTDGKWRLVIPPKFSTVVKKALEDLQQGGAPGSEGNKRWWVKRLQELYDAAKQRNGGNSLSLYGDVVRLLDYLEEIEEVPEGFDLFQACDNLASRLRNA